MHSESAPLFAPLPSAPSPPVLPVRPPVPEHVDWTGLGESSFRLLAVMHGFRWLTEAGTRGSEVGLGSGYSSSVLNLHIWQLNDPRYNQAEFGGAVPTGRANFAPPLSPGRLASGLASEAFIGHKQRDFPQQSFVDHVITPTIGLSWMIAEDALDRYLVRQLD